MEPRTVSDLYTTEEPSAAARAAEVVQAWRVAERHRLEFVDMGRFNIDHELFRQIPADLMLRYGFVPYRREGGAPRDRGVGPTDLPMIDELGALLATPIRVCVGTPSAIQAILKKSESSQRVLDQATESFQMQILRDEDVAAAEDSLTVDRITSDASPVIRLVDSTIYTAIQRRRERHPYRDRRRRGMQASTGSTACSSRRCGRSTGASTARSSPASRSWRSSISPRSAPQDGRFKLRCPRRRSTFASIMPSVHGEDAVIRILDKESISEQFKELRLDILGFRSPS